MDIPAHVQAALGIGSPIAEDILTSAADSWPTTQTIFGLSGAEFTTAVAESQTLREKIVVSKPSRVNQSAWKYLELLNNGVPDNWILSTPNDGAGIPPTAIGQALVKAWLLEPAILNNGIMQGVLVQGVAHGAIFEKFTVLLAKEWVEVCFFLEGVTPSPSWVTKSRIEIVSGARLVSTEINFKYERLLLETVSEHKAKWRFLSLYRILEHGYLLQVFQALESEFFNLPEISLQNALKLVKSEVSQFVALADKASLQAEFKNFFDEFEKLKNGGNLLANAIDHSIRQHGQQNTVFGDSQMGVLLCYKLRCSIVHAGLSAPIFDAYPDASALLDAVLPICESIALRFLGISIT